MSFLKAIIYLTFMFGIPTFAIWYDDLWVNIIATMGLAVTAAVFMTAAIQLARIQGAGKL